MVKLTRRQFTVLPAAVLATAGTKASRPQPASPVTMRAIPATGEPLPPVGLGTAEVFDVADTSTLQKAGAVVRALSGNGGKLIDTASTYGDAERILGDVIGPSALRGNLLLRPSSSPPMSRSLNARLIVCRLPSSTCCNSTM